jgi:hypothetical protein
MKRIDEKSNPTLLQGYGSGVRNMAVASIWLQISICLVFWEAIFDLLILPRENAQGMMSISFTIHKRVLAAPPHA